MKRLAGEMVEARVQLSGSPYLVEDLLQAPASSSPGSLAAFQDQVFFVADDGVHGRELWKSNGTVDGTTLVKDIRPGVEGSAPRDFIQLDEQAFFVATSDGLGDQLWATDGSSEGTRSIMRSGFIHSPASFRGELYFLSENELWKTDGSEQNARPVGASSAFHRVWDLFVWKDSLFFSAEGAAGIGLWRTDGDKVDLVISSSNPRRVAAFKDVLFVTTTERGSDSEVLWRTDGTAAGTTKLKQLEGSQFGQTGATDNTLLFLTSSADAPSAIWRSDGSVEGTYRLDLSDGFAPRNLLQGSQRVFVSGSGNSGDTVWQIDETEQLQSVDAVSTGTRGALATSLLNGDEYLLGQSLWKIDPTGPEAIKIKDVGSPKFQTELIEVDGKLFFSGSENGEVELWKSNGTPEGTEQVVDLNPGLAPDPDNSWPRDLVAVNDLLFFTHNGLRVSDGTVDDTRLLSETFPTDLVAFGDVALYHDGTSLWSSDGTIEGTEQFFEFSKADSDELGRTLPSRTDFTQLADEMFFFVDSPEFGRELWKTDGTAEGTLVVASILPHGVDEGAIELVEFAHAIFFRVNGEASQQIWRSDGSPEGTSLFIDLGPPSDVPPHPSQRASDYPFDFEVAGDTMFFAVDTAEFGRELWKTDGTVEGTVRLTDVIAGPESSIIHRNPFWISNGGVFFDIENEVGGSSLWKSDGTPSGTNSVSDISPPGFRTLFIDAADFEGSIYFPGFSNDEGLELWRSDGTEQGTEILKRLFEGRTNGSPSRLTVFDGKLYFTASSHGVGRELWVTDGTEEGTKLAADIWPGSEGSSPFDLTVVGDRLFFTADDGVHGRELWALPAAEMNSADIDGDGEVAFADFLILSQHFGSVGVGLHQGDLDDDDEVTFADFLILSDQFGRTVF